MNRTPAESAILIDLLVNGDNTSGNISQAIEKERSYVSRLLGELEDDDLVRNKGRGVYTLTPEGVAIARELYRK